MTSHLTTVSEQTAVNSACTSSIVTDSKLRHALGCWPPRTDLGINNHM
jgi:hypothetical protein